MKKNSISLMQGVEIPIGPTPPLAKPPAAALERLRRRIRDYLDRVDPSEWDDFAHREPHEGVPLPWVQVEAWKLIVEREPEQPSYQMHLADAWVELGDLERALAIAHEVHVAVPDWPDAVELIVKLLDVLGRDYRQHPWVEAPAVAVLDDGTRERCAAWLAEHGPTDDLELMFDLFEDEVCLFEPRELARFLAEDPRFEVIFEDHAAYLYPAEASTA